MVCDWAVLGFFQAAWDALALGKGGKQSRPSDRALRWRVNPSKCRCFCGGEVFNRADCCGVSLVWGLG